MNKTPLYQEIAESIRHEILYGLLQPKDELPTVLGMAEKWHCAPGTVQRAYRELARQGLVTARPGAGTTVAAHAKVDARTPLRRSMLVNQAETFLLSSLTAGYTPAEIEQAVQAALDRWRASAQRHPTPPTDILRFAGSHDPAVTLLFARFGEEQTEARVEVAYMGSLGGLMALARHEAEIAGSHLWDEATDAYNQAFVQHLLPGQRVALVRVAERRLGLITAHGNPGGITGLESLIHPDVRFINRQEGAGTRVWLEAQLHRLGIAHEAIAHYGSAALTHSEVASAITNGRADTGLCIEAVAQTYGLDFIPLTTECYDLVIPSEQWERLPVKMLVTLLASAEMRAAINQLGGYDARQTGMVTWVG